MMYWNEISERKRYTLSDEDVPLQITNFLFVANIYKVFFRKLYIKIMNINIIPKRKIIEISNNAKPYSTSSRT